MGVYMTETNALLKASDGTKSSINTIPRKSVVDQLQGHVDTLQSMIDNPNTAEHFKVKYRDIHDKAKSALATAHTEAKTPIAIKTLVPAPIASDTPVLDAHKEHSRQLLELVRLRTMVKDPDMHQRIDDAIKTHLANKTIK